MENIWAQLWWNGNNMVMLALKPNTDYPLELVRPHMDFLDLNVTIEPFWTWKDWKQETNPKLTFKIAQNKSYCSPTILIGVQQMVSGEQVNGE